MLYTLDQVLPTAQYDIRKLLAEVGPRNYTPTLERKVSVGGGSLWRVVAPDAPFPDPRHSSNACWYRCPDKAKASWERRLAQAVVWGLAPALEASRA